MSSIGWPLASNVIRRNLVNHTFGMVRRNADGSPKAHQGWDFSARIGTPCFAIADGMIALVYESGDYGLVVVLAFLHEGKMRYAAYAHLRHSNVEAGDRVSRGQQIGLTGESGNAKGMAEIDQHLHFEIRTVARPGAGLAGRLSPLTVFGICPLTAPVELVRVA